MTKKQEQDLMLAQQALLVLSKATEIAQKVFQVQPSVVSADNAVNIQHAAKVIDLFSGQAIGGEDGHAENGDR